jgi:hypothetical protein
VRSSSTELSVSEAKKARFLPPCACAFPPGFDGSGETAACATQTDVAQTLIQHVQTCESEQGAIQLADDGRAETPTRIEEIGDFIVGLQSVGCFRCRDLVGDVQSFDKSTDVQIFEEQKICDVMQFNKVVHDHNFAGAEDEVQVEGTAEIVQCFLDATLCDMDEKIRILHDHESPRDQNFVGSSDEHKPASAIALA